MGRGTRRMALRMVGLPYVPQMAPARVFKNSDLDCKVDVELSS